MTISPLSCLERTSEEDPRLAAALNRVARDPFALLKIDHDFRSNKAVVMTAVSRFGYPYRFKDLSHELKSDVEVVICAVTHTFELIKEVPLAQLYHPDVLTVIRQKIAENPDRINALPVEMQDPKVIFSERFYWIAACCVIFRG